jgi:hypothetical protein
MRLVPLVFIVAAVLCVVVAALLPVSKAKGWTRLSGSLSLGTGLAMGLLQAAPEGHLWQRFMGLVLVLILMWVGVRKHKRDPEGRTPSAQIL